MTKPFIVKQNPEIPDHYGMELIFVNGSKKLVEIAGHWIRETTMIFCSNGDFINSNNERYRVEPSHNPFLEYVTKDDKWSVIPMSSIQEINLDKNWSKLVALKNKK